MGAVLTIISGGLAAVVDLEKHTCVIIINHVLELVVVVVVEASHSRG